MKIQINDQLGEVSSITQDLPSPKATIILAHGAGAGMLHPFMETLAESLHIGGFRVIRFNFPYMEGGKKSTGSAKHNIEAWRNVFCYTRERYPEEPIFISGKSYGGRMASHLVVETDVIPAGIIYFGFPLHTPGKDSKDRAMHLIKIEVPQLFLQGTHDKLANMALMEEVVADLQDARLVRIDHADHSFKRPKKYETGTDIMQEIVDPATAFMTKK